MSVTEKLVKTHASIVAHFERGGRINGKRSNLLIARYNELRLQAKELKQWSAYCRDLQLSPKHDAFKFF